MSDIKLGTKPTKEHKRDAIHIAIIPIVAAQDLEPGTRVRIREDYKAGEPYDFIGKDKPDETVGIVDPFLKTTVKEGELFWLLLDQNTIQGMRHHWQHPTFPDELDADATSSEQWLRNFAKLYYHDDYDNLIKYASNGVIYFGTDWYPEDKSDEFWQHYNKVTGKNITGYFRCAC